MLDFLGELNAYEKVHACKQIGNIQVFEVDPNDPQAIEKLFYQAEALRLLGCEPLKSVVSEVERVLNNPETVLSSVDSHYFAFMLYKRAKHYGANRSERLMDTISNQVTTSWLSDLNEKKFSMIEGAGDKRSDLSPV